VADVDLTTHECTLLPVTIEELTCDRPFVLLAPHPDDDILGAAGLMRQAHQRGIPFAVVFLTTGGASHHHPDWPADRLAQLRRTEARSALSVLLGFEPPTLFCALPDGKLADSWDAQTILAIAAFCRNHNAHAAFVTDPNDDHADHKAAFGIASVLWWMGVVGALWTMPVGTRLAGAQPGDMFRTLAVRGEANRKHAAINAHRSQRGAVIPPEAGFTLTEDMIAPFLEQELFWPVAGVDETREAPNDPDEFDQLFSQSADPWHYDVAPYEQVRFARTIEALGGRRFHSGLEVACAAGVLTERIAPHCDQLVAVDASREAIAHARRRLQQWTHIDIRVARMPDQLPDGRFDLIMLSDVLYYFGLRGLMEFLLAVIDRAQPDAMIVLVDYLGPMGIAVNGEMAAEASIALARLHGWEPTRHERNDTMRLDRLEPAR
jgi:LmbE family N-acetylglucosaminyl deacetylase